MDLGGLHAEGPHAAQAEAEELIFREGLDDAAGQGAVALPVDDEVGDGHDSGGRHGIGYGHE
ncbi:hypothetical protein [Deinococcus aquaticus]|uniref:hypothetical protein n=1 Tax=Deinococcus aquaticus TaxID=328692 RepID=UPI003606DA95